MSRDRATGLPLEDADGSFSTDRTLTRVRDSGKEDGFMWTVVTREKIMREPALYVIVSTEDNEHTYS